tara:strand:- start:34 stop:579 length:546 start_codon:yes stop_codon:yes gene_type:complete
MSSIIRVNDIQDAGGNSIVSSNGSGTVTLGNSALKNTPSFFAFLSSAQTISSGTATKIQCNTERLDTDNTYDNSSNYRFTPGIAGKYLIYGSVMCGAGSEELTEAEAYIYVNGSVGSKSSFNHTNQRANVVSPYTSIIYDASTTDYFELYASITDNSGSPSAFGDSTQVRTYFGAYKLIGA